MTDLTTIDTPDNQSRSQRIEGKSHALAERERVSEILSIGRAHKMENEAARAVESGASLDSFRAQTLSRLKDSGALRFAESTDIGLSQREVENFSFVRAILSQTDANYATRHCGFEMEASRAMEQKLGKPAQGILVPSEVLRHNHQRDLLAGTPAAGGNLVATDLLGASFIELLRNRAHVLALGATPLGDLRGNVAIPSQTGAAQAFWVAEGVAPTETQQVFGQVLLSAKTIAAFTDYSRKMLLQSSVDIEGVVRADLASIIGVELDRVAIHGSGVGSEPRGILNTAGIGAVAIGANGGALTWSHILQLEEAIANSNADAGALAYLSNNRVRRALKSTTKTADGASGFIWPDQVNDQNNFGRLNGYIAASSTNVPSSLVKGTGTNLSAMIFGNWQDVLLGMWGGLDILVDRTTNGTSGGTRVIALLDADVAIRRAASFAAIIDAAT